jgi:hypothetical protein
LGKNVAVAFIWGVAGEASGFVNNRMHVVFGSFGSLLFSLLLSDMLKKTSLF